jgi:hypothetical protein
VGTLDAGDMTIAGVGGAEVLTEYDYTSYGSPFYYFGQPVPLSAIPTTSATFTFAAAGGHDIGSFTATLNMPVAPAFTNFSSLTDVARSDGLTVTWTPGGAGVVRIWGVPMPGEYPAIWLPNSFSCTAPASDGQLTVPSYVLQTLPAGTTQLAAKFYANPQMFSAPGLDVGVATADPVPVAPITVTFR